MDKVSTFIYAGTEIHFLLNPDDRNVMISATEMAKAFGKRIDVFLKTDHVESFILALESPFNANVSETNHSSEFPPYGGNSPALKRDEIIKTRGQLGTFFCRPLALKFAAWLDPHFEVWVYSTIDELVFGNYKKHWEAHAQQESAKLRMDELKNQMLISPTVENVHAYFEAERSLQEAKRRKTLAIRNQISLFNQDEA